MTDVYAAVEAMVRIHDQQTNAECEVLGVNRSAYSVGLTPGRSAQAARDAKLPPLVRDLFWTHRRRDGTRRIVAELAERGESRGTRRVAKLRKTPGLSALQPKSFVPETTDSRHRRGDRPNLLPDLPTLTAIHSRWVGDITYVPLAGGAFGDLATRRDRGSRRLVGWHLAESMTEDLVIPVLPAAIRERQPAPRLIHHTDRGGQYASTPTPAIALSCAAPTSAKACAAPTTATTTPSWNPASEPSRRNSK